MEINPNAIKRILSMPTSTAAPDGTMPISEPIQGDGIDRTVGLRKSRQGRRNETSGPRAGGGPRKAIEGSARMVYRSAV